MMKVSTSCKMVSSDVAQWIRSKRSGLNAAMETLLIVTSYVTGLSVGARDNASATGISFPGVYTIVYEYS